jgi:formylglycine-generating enzyme required for sulfatase activity
MLENESNKYQFFIRPRKFGKSLFFSMLLNYYDMLRAGRFDELFGDFYIGKYPVTQGLWTRIMGDNPSKFKGDDSQPVEQVSWDDAEEFIWRLNQETGKNYRLPTEAEWEYAARGGARSRGYKYSGSDNIDRVAWYGDWTIGDDEEAVEIGGGNSGNTTHPVGTKLPNELGIYDMSGNVWEWVSDWYGEYTADVQTNPIGPPSGSCLVFRGGSWDSGARYCRVSNRDFGGLDVRITILGFRLVLCP